MDEKTVYSKTEKRIELFLQITACLLLLTNASFIFTRQERFSGLMPLSIALCAVSTILTAVGLVAVIRNYKRLSKKGSAVFGCIALSVLCGIEVCLSVSAVADMVAKRNAENYAAAYVKEKYGFDAEAVGYSSKTYLRSAGSETVVKMTADGKEFNVFFITVGNKSSLFADDYQSEKIEQAVFEEVSRAYPGGVLRDLQIINLSYPAYDFFRDSSVHEFFEEYFDGTNLDSVFESRYGYYGCIVVDFADTKFDLSDPIFGKLEKWNMQPYFTSFDTAERLEEFVAGGEPESAFRREEQYAKYAPYITDRVKYDDGNIVRGTFDLKLWGDMKYCYLYGSDDAGFTSPGIGVTENGMEEIKEKFSKYDESALVAAPVSNAYEVYGKSGTHLIYCPLKSLNGVSADNIGAAWISKQTGIVNNRGVAKASVCGEYAVFTLPYDTKEFMLVDTGG